MTQAEMKTALKRYGFDDTDPLITWLDWGLHELEREHEWPFLVGEDSTTAAIGAGEVFDTGLPGIFIVQLQDNSDPMEYLSVEEFRRKTDKTSTGSPYYWTFGPDPDDLRIWPKVTVATNIDLVYHKEEPEIVTLSGGDSLSFFPKGMHYLIVLRAAAFGLQAENEEDRASSELEAYKTGVLTAISRYGTPRRRSGRTVDDVMNYGSN